MRTTDQCLSMQRFTLYSSTFCECKIPVVPSILLDQIIDGIPEYPQTADPIFLFSWLSGALLRLTFNG